MSLPDPAAREPQAGRPGHRLLRFPMSPLHALYPLFHAMLHSLLSSRRWRTRMVLWLAAALAGLAAVAFAQLCNLALRIFGTATQGRLWLTLLLTPAVGMAVVWAGQRRFPGIQGSGIPQTIAAIRQLGVQGRAEGLLSLRIAAAKVGLGAAALLGGFSAGREGPTVQISASIMYYAHRLLPAARAVRAADLALAGGAAGIAAAFNTPLAGITFAIEELGRRYESRSSGLLLSTIIVAGLTAIALEGDYRYFGELSVDSVGPRVLLPVLGGGLLCGLAGGAFSRLLLWPRRAAGSRLWALRRERPVLFAGACGLCVAAIGWAAGGVSLGSGYAITAQALDGSVALPWYAPVARFAATVITYFSGIPGGIFAPSLAVGAAIGIDLSRLFDGAIGMHTTVAICMTAFLAAVTQSPITSAIIVMEMIDGHAMVISLMATALVAKAVAERMGPELYQQLSMDFLMPAPAPPAPPAGADATALAPVPASGGTQA